MIRGYFRSTDQSGVIYRALGDDSFETWATWKFRRPVRLLVSPRSARDIGQRMRVILDR